MLILLYVIPAYAFGQARQSRVARGSLDAPCKCNVRSDKWR
jgi:hypothetical protein